MDRLLKFSQNSSVHEDDHQVEDAYYKVSVILVDEDVENGFVLVLSRAP